MTVELVSLSSTNNLLPWSQQIISAKKPFLVIIAVQARGKKKLSNY